MTLERQGAAGEQQAVARTESTIGIPADDPRHNLFNADAGDCAFELHENITTIGRSTGAEIRLPDRALRCDPATRFAPAQATTANLERNSWT